MGIFGTRNNIFFTPKTVSNNGCWILESCDYINKRKCLICELVEDLPNTSDINISSNMEAPANKECCPEGRYIEEVVDKAPVKVGSRTKIEKSRLILIVPIGNVR